MQLVEAERAALGDGERGAHAVEVAAPAPRDLRRPLEVPLAVGAKARAHLVERPLVPQRHEHVVHRTVARARVVHVVGDDPRHVECAGDVDEARRRLAFFGQAVVPAFDGHSAIECIFHVGRRFARCVRVATGGERRHPAARAPREREQAVGVRGELVQ